MKNKRKGKFIVFEGIDGAGKSTQIKLLYKRLTENGYNCVITEEPGGTTLGKKIKNILLNSDMQLSPKAELFLFLADRAEHAKKVLIPELQKGNIVLSSRYFFSTIVYQGIARKLFEINFITKINMFAVDNLLPDLVLYIDVPPEKAINKMYSRNKSNKLDRIETEGISFLQRVRNGYLSIIKNYPELFVIINGEGKIENIGDEIYKNVQRRILDA